MINENYVRGGLLLVVLILAATFAPTPTVPPAGSSGAATSAVSEPQAVVLPLGAVTAQLFESGVVDRDGFEALYAARGGISPTVQKVLTGEKRDLRVTATNAGEVLNLLWAMGLGQKHKALVEGPMMDMRYGGAGGFASTGGWPLAQDGAMAHYGRHQFVTLTSEEAALAGDVAGLVYRPCCDNHAAFPDCNHGMAMLGAMELLAAEGKSRAELFAAAAILNRLWFPDQYRIIDLWASRAGNSYDRRPEVLVGKSVASASGFARVRAQVETTPVQAGGCAV